MELFLYDLLCGDSVFNLKIKRNRCDSFCFLFDLRHSVTLYYMRVLFITFWFVDGEYG